MNICVRSKGYTATFNFTCANTASGFAYSLQLPPGSYEARIQRGSYSTNAGVNLIAVNYQAATNIQVNGNLSGLVLAENGITIGGSITVNGQAVSRSATYCSMSGNENDGIGSVTFSDSSKGYTATYNFTCANTASGFTYSLLLPPGTYEARIQRGSYSTNANVNLIGVNYLAAVGLRVQ